MEFGGHGRGHTGVWLKTKFGFSKGDGECRDTAVSTLVANIAERWMRRLIRSPSVPAACVSAVGIFRDAAFIAAVQARPLAPAVAGSIGAVTAAPAGDAANRAGRCAKAAKLVDRRPRPRKAASASARERFMIRLLWF